MPLLTTQEKATWIAALRADNHKQGTAGILKHEPDSTFCCLGVALDVIHGDKIWQTRKPTVTTRPVGHLAPCELFGDITHLGHFGALKMPNLEIGVNIHHSLAEANDCGVSFSSLADHIEKYMPVRDSPV